MAYVIKLELLGDNCCGKISRSFKFDLMVDAVNTVAVVLKCSDKLTARVEEAKVVDTQYKKLEDITEMFKVLVEKAME